MFNLLAKGLSQDISKEVRLRMQKSFCGSTNDSIIKDIQAPDKKKTNHFITVF
jgi:hypothetical protein